MLQPQSGVLDSLCVCLQGTSPCFWNIPRLGNTSRDHSRAQRLQEHRRVHLQRGCRLRLRRSFSARATYGAGDSVVCAGIMPHHFLYCRLPVYHLRAKGNAARAQQTYM